MEQIELSEGVLAPGHEPQDAVAILAEELLLLEEFIALNPDASHIFADTFERETKRLAAMRADIDASIAESDARHVGSGVVHLLSS